MKATTLILAFALIVAVSTAQSTTANATGVNCTTNKAICAATNPLFCCANVVRYVNASYSNTTQACVNLTIANKTVDYRSFASTYGNATCLVSSVVNNNSVLVKLSAAVASLGLLSLFL